MAALEPARMSWPIRISLSASECAPAVEVLAYTNLVLTQGQLSGGWLPVPEHMLFLFAPNVALVALVGGILGLRPDRRHGGIWGLLAIGLALLALVGSIAVLMSAMGTT